jgi:hypothetical protein
VPLRPKRLSQHQPGITDVTRYTATGITYAILKEVVIVNTTAGAVSFDMSLVVSGGSVSDANRLIRNASIDPYTTVIFKFSQILEPGDFISTKAGVATSLAVHISGAEVTP